jgi:hypothetical protein
VWTTTTAGLALLRVGHRRLATVLAAAAAGLVFDLAGRLPGPLGRRVAAAPHRPTSSAGEVRLRQATRR